ncbi:hypothetical protein ABH973_006226 [Bradyrhizobium ottawaense]|uniref:hypothetical protein n=1 Tax=Bradyrhizobium ottawaense TaxID=931866 RepID=UPI00351525A0
MTSTKLQLLLSALRSFNDYIVTDGGLSPQSIANQMRLERLVADRVMFNAGWYGAREAKVDDLGGMASTDALAPILMNLAEHARDYAGAIGRLAKANADLAELNKPGRKKGSYERWHFEPGYSVVIAAIETDAGKKPPAHVRWAVKEGWLAKDIPDKTHLRRITLIRERMAREDAARLAAIGANVVPFRPKRKPQKRLK